MPEKTKKIGFAIALAWPETYCKQAGAWYDPIMNFLGINTNFHYKVGHAAVILVDSISGECHYFDFGRYHAPFGHGRVRNQTTDNDLIIRTKAIISDFGSIENIHEILSELYHNPSCHGSGIIQASYTKIRFDRALNTALKMQQKSPWNYGPFIWNGTNCSRFVRTVILSGKPRVLKAFRLRFPLTLSPTPIGNVRSLDNKTINHPEENMFSDRSTKVNRPFLFPLEIKKTLTKPTKAPLIPLNAQWLAGEGAGSWFFIESAKPGYKVTRFNELGEPECSGYFLKLGNYTLDLSKPFKFTHLSHCDQVNIEQSGKTIPLKRIEKTTYNKKYDTYSHMQIQ